MKQEPKIEEKILYGYTNDLSRMPTCYSRFYDEILRMAKEASANWKKPYYIIELTEHYEVCGCIGGEDSNADEA